MLPKEKLVRKIVIIGLSLVVVIAGFSAVNKKTHLTSKVNKITGEVAGVAFYTGRFLDSISWPIDAIVPSPYQTVGGDVAISGRVGIVDNSTDYALRVKQNNSGGQAVAIMPGNDDLFALLINNTANNITRHGFFGSGNAYLANGAGSVGIGGATPNAKLHVAGVGGSGYTFIAADASGNYLASIEPGKTLLGRDGGNVGIGTVGPVEKLDVAGNIALTNDYSAIRFMSAAGPSDLYMDVEPGTRTVRTRNWNTGAPNVPATSIHTGSGIFEGLITSTNNGAAYLKGGDDATLNDVNVANTMGVYGAQDSTVGNIRLGSGGGTISGYNDNVGIGTASPGTKLDVRGMITSNTGGICASTYCADVPSFSGTYGIKSDGGILMTNGTASKPGGGSWSDTSDNRLKKNVRPITNALEKISQLQGVNFEWINPAEHGNRLGTQGGFIAQDIEKIFPNWITRINPSGQDQNLVGTGDKIESLTLPFEYDALIAEAIKEQQKQISPLLSIIDIVNKIGHFVQIETQKLIVNGVDILEKLNALSQKVDAQQKEIDSLKAEIEQLKAK